MAQEIITLEDLHQFRLQLLDDLRGLLQQPTHSEKQWLRSSEVRKMLAFLMARYKIFGLKMYCLTKRLVG